MSRWFEGSSRSITSGLCKSSLASIIRDCWPPENSRRLAVEVRLGEAEAHQDFLDPVVDRIGVLVLDQLVERVVSARGPLAVVVVLRLGHLLRGLLQLVLEVHHRGQPRLDDVDHRLVGREIGLLPEQADPDAGPDEQVAVIGLIAAGQDPHQRGLAGAVGADQPDPLARADLERQVHEDRIAAILPAQPLCRDEDHEFARFLRINSTGDSSRCRDGRAGCAGRLLLGSGTRSAMDGFSADPVRHSRTYLRHSTGIYLRVTFSRRSSPGDRSDSNGESNPSRGSRAGFRRSPGGMSSFVFAQGPFLAEQVVIVPGEPVGFVADVLQEPQGERASAQHDRVGPAGHEDLFLLLGEGDDGRRGDLERVESGQGGRS